MSTGAEVWSVGKRQFRRSWLMALLVVLVGVLYAGVIPELVADWWKYPDYSHGFVVPVFSGYLLWRDRHRWQNASSEPHNLGLLVMVGAILLLIAGSLGAELFTSRFSLILLICGMVLYWKGKEVLKAIAFPVGFLVLMIPLPALVYNQITFPLQLLASRLAAGCLQMIRVPVLREGNLLILPNYTLEVVEACSGIRSLMSLIALALAYGYLADDRRWTRLALVALMVPIAVMSNGLRIVGSGVLTYWVGPQVAEGFFHLFSGWLIFLTAMLMMILAHWALKRIGKLKRGEAHA